MYSVYTNMILNFTLFSNNHCIVFKHVLILKVLQMPFQSTQFAKISWGGMPPDPPSFSLLVLFPVPFESTKFSKISWGACFHIPLLHSSIPLKRLLVFCSDGLTTIKMLDPALYHHCVQKVKHILLTAYYISNPKQPSCKRTVRPSKRLW